MEIEDLDYAFFKKDLPLAGIFYHGYIYENKLLILNREYFSKNTCWGLQYNDCKKLNKNFYDNNNYGGLYIDLAMIDFMIPSRLVKDFKNEIEIISKTTDPEIRLYILETIKNKLNESK